MPPGSLNPYDAAEHVRSVQIVGEFPLFLALDMQPLRREALTQRRRIAMQRRRRNEALVNPPIAVAPTKPQPPVAAVGAPALAQNFERPGDWLLNHRSSFDGPAHHFDFEPVRRHRERAK
jgi:hypothetical protein